MVNWRWLRRLCGYYQQEAELTEKIVWLAKRINVMEVEATQKKVMNAATLYSARMLLSEWIKNAEFTASQTLGDAKPNYPENSLIIRSQRYIDSIITKEQNNAN
jgi:hypothetical protein